VLKVNHENILKRPPRVSVQFWSSLPQSGL
jgi:hypothetical protein